MKRDGPGGDFLACLCWGTSRALLGCSEWRGVPRGTLLCCSVLKDRRGNLYWVPEWGGPRVSVQGVSDDNGRHQGSLSAVAQMEMNGYGEPFWGAMAGTHCWGAKDKRWVTIS